MPEVYQRQHIIHAAPRENQPPGSPTYILFENSYGVKQSASFAEVYEVHRKFEREVSIEKVDHLLEIKSGSVSAKIEVNQGLHGAPLAYFIDLNEKKYFYNGYINDPDNVNDPKRHRWIRKLDDIQGAITAMEEARSGIVDVYQEYLDNKAAATQAQGLLALDSILHQTTKSVEPLPVAA